MRIGYLMGTFDPIHIGHIANIVDVLNRDLVDRVYIVPTTHNPVKDFPSVAFDHRVRMCELCAEEINRIVCDNNWQAKVYTSDVENTLEDNHYSVDVLRKIKEDDYGNDLFIIGGTDIEETIKSWKESEWILENFGFIKVERPGYSGYSRPYGIELSSTDIRDMVVKGESIYPYIPLRVAEYIKNNELYEIL